MIFRNSPQDIEILNPDVTKVVGLKISGGADSALVICLVSMLLKSVPYSKIISRDNPTR